MKSNWRRLPSGMQRHALPFPTGDRRQVADALAEQTGFTAAYAAAAPLTAILPVDDSGVIVAAAASSRLREGTATRPWSKSMVCC